MTERYDLIVLGAGSGGLATAFRAASLGARVALLDPAAELGGTCVNRGCVPKKALWFSAQLAHAQALAVEFGFDSRPGALDWAHFCGLRTRYIDGIGQRYAKRLHEENIEVINQAGRFVAVETIALTDGRQLHAPHIVIATGGRPKKLDLPGFALGLVSDDMFTLPVLPARIAIVGGGYIAVEFAGMLRALGTEVDMLAVGKLLKTFDHDIVDALMHNLQAHGVQVDLQSAIKGLRRTPDGLVLEDEKAGSRGPYDAVLWAVGRVPNSEHLGLDVVGVSTDEKGHIITDDTQATIVPGVYAVGDVTTDKALTPVAVARGRRLADRLFASPPAFAHSENIPSVVFADPPLATVGLSEAQARERHGDAVSIHHRQFTPMPFALVKRDQKSLMKLVCVGEDERIVGIHLIGMGADEMMQGFAVAMNMGLRKGDLDGSIAIHPTSAEELLSMD
jgi:glutathione reductase (NADPH)